MLAPLLSFQRLSLRFSPSNLTEAQALFARGHTYSVATAPGSRHSLLHDLGSCCLLGKDLYLYLCCC